ncbi:MAG: hypothetical protein N2385_03590 [Chloroflexus sp.]|nr:hypothetical protein [Chloroflexus sp.]
MRLASAIFLLSCGFYLLTMSGHTYSADEETMLAVTRSLIERGDVAVMAVDESPFVALRPGLDDKGYSPFGVLPSLLAVPFHLLGSLIASSGPRFDYATRFAVTALNGLLTAATCAVLARWALRLGATKVWAAVLALLYGLATFAWPYARTFFSEPLAALLILVASERAHAAWQDPRPAARRIALLVSGLAAGLLLPTRIAAGITLPIFGFYVLWSAWRSSAGTTISAVTGRRVAHTLNLVGIWISGMIPGILIFIWYNLARFGTPLASGYASEAYLFTTPLLEGLTGLLFSPGKSVFLYAPPILLAIPGGIALWRRGERAVVLLALGLFLSQLGLYARWGQWQGGGVWGPRFLLPVVAPLMALGAGMFSSGTTRLPIGHWRVAVVMCLGLLGFAGNLGGVLLNFDTYIVSVPAEERDYRIESSPLLGHYRLLLERWQRYSTAPPVCKLGAGIYSSEAEDGALLPRRTGMRGVVNCITEVGGRLTLIIDDYRPAEAPPSALRLRLNGTDLGALPEGQRRAYHIFIEPGHVQLEIVARAWNPMSVGFSDRNELLGPLIKELRGVTSQGDELAIVDTAIAPLPTNPPIYRWAWNYEPHNQHLVDHWAWYLPRSELAGLHAQRLARFIIIAGTGLMVGGLMLLVGERLLSSRRSLRRS